MMGIYIYFSTTHRHGIAQLSLQGSYKIFPTFFEIVPVSMLTETEPERGLVLSP